MATSAPLESTSERPSASTPTPAASLATPVFRAGTHKSCDACKRRKVKCPNANYPAPCGNCDRRGTTCHFGLKKTPARNVSKHHKTSGYRVIVLNRTEESSSNSPQVASPVIQTNGGGIPKLYIDHLLDQAQEQAHSRTAMPFAKGNGIFGGIYSLTFFSENRLLSLSTRLKNNKVNDLVCRINAIIGGRVRRSDHADAQSSPVLPLSSNNGISASSGIAASSTTPSTMGNASTSLAIQVSPSHASTYIQCYFERAHPLYPFLDRAAFNARITNVPPDVLAGNLMRSKAWSALYHSILAIGCLYADRDDEGGGSFEPGKGAAWRIFSVALGQFSELMILPDSLITLQALTAMAVYGMGAACLSIERVILSEATRRAQSLAAAGHGTGSILTHGSFSLTASSATATFQRTFWLLYEMDKVMSFYLGRSSTFIDSDIACPYPASLPAVAPDSTSPDWFLLRVRFARLLSRTYLSLLSIGNVCDSPFSSLATIEQLRAESEEWRQSIPEKGGMRPNVATVHGFRRKEKFQPGTSVGGASNGIWSYNLCSPETELHHLARLPYLSTEQQQQKTSAEQVNMVSARTILELTPFIDVEPYTALWCLAVIPLTALLTLFDVVIHRPRSPETTSNLALLDMAAGYFSRIEYASDNSLPGSLISEFAHIARDYINDQRRDHDNGQIPNTIKEGVQNNRNTSLNLPQPLFSAATEPLLATPSSTTLANEVTTTEWTATSQTVRSPQERADTLTSGMSPVLGGLSSGDGNSGNLSYTFGLGDITEPGGTDVMGLFSYFLPEMDSMLFQGISEDE